MTKTIRVGSVRDWISLFQTRSLGIKWITAVLAFVTVFQVSRNWRRARPLVWLFNVFGTLDSRPEMKIRPEDRALSELMQRYWVNFARTGDPNGSGLPQWPTYSPSTTWQVMHLDSTPHAEADKFRDRYLFLDKVLSAH